MMLNVAIYGLGRIGRLFFKQKKNLFCGLQKQVTFKVCRSPPRCFLTYYLPIIFLLLICG